METINIKSNLVELNVQRDGDIIGKIKFDPTDIAIIERISKALKTINAMTPQDFIPEDEADEIEQASIVAGNMREAVYAQIDYIFGYPVCDVVFGETFSIGFITNFIVAVKPVIERYIKQYQKESQARVDKYIVPQKKGKKK